MQRQAVTLITYYSRHIKVKWGLYSSGSFRGVSRWGLAFGDSP